MTTSYYFWWPDDTIENGLQEFKKACSISSVNAGNSVSVIPANKGWQGIHAVACSWSGWLE